MNSQKVPPIKILTLNMHKGFSVGNRRFILHELRDAIRLADAEVVLLQEVLGEHRDHSTRWERWPDNSQYEFLADSIWSEFAYGKNAVYPEGHHGNALLSKLGIVRSKNHDISIYSKEKRGLLHCELDNPGGTTNIHVICVHLGLLQRHRQMQLDMLCELIERDIPADAALIIGGDFNDWGQKGHRVLADRAGLREVFIDAFGQAARSFPVWFPVLRLDRLYVRNVKVSKPVILAQKPWSRLSDHAALSLEIRI